MAMNHQISSNVYDRYHGAVKAKESHSQKQLEHDGRRAGAGEEGSKYRPQIRDVFDRGLRPVAANHGPHQLCDRAGETDRRHDHIDEHSHNRNYDRYDSVGKNVHRQDAGHHLYGNIKNGLTGTYGTFQGGTQVYQFTQITITHSSVFSGAHLGNSKESNEARQSFLNAALEYLKNPSEKAYKSLNDAMTKLMDPKFTPSRVGGEAQVRIISVGATTKAKFTMEVTPAPTKTLEEAREDLRNAYSTRRDGEKDIASIRAEAYTNYIRALSEKFKKDGVISHTNNTPTTPVFKSSVIYSAKVSQVSVISFNEIRKPEFGHNFHGKLKFKNQHGFWNDYRQNHKSYVDLLKHDSPKPYNNHHEDHKAAKGSELKHSYRTGEGKAERTGHTHHNKARIDKAG